MSVRPFDSTRVYWAPANTEPTAAELKAATMLTTPAPDGAELLRRYMERAWPRRDLASEAREAMAPLPTRRMGKR